MKGPRVAKCGEDRGRRRSRGYALLTGSLCVTDRQTCCKVSVKWAL